MPTTTTWTDANGDSGATWDVGSNWTNGAPTLNGDPVWPAEEADITAGLVFYTDATLSQTDVLLDGASSTPVLAIDYDGETLDSGVIVANTEANTTGIFNPNGGLDNQGTLLADAAGGVLQIDAITESNSLLRQLWTSEGVLRATGGGTLEIGQSIATQTEEGSGVPEFDYLQSNGTILADDGGTVQLNYAIGSEGLVIASGGTIAAELGPGLSGIEEEYNALLPVAGPGVVYISNGGVVDDAGGIGEPVYFTDSTGTLVLEGSSVSEPLLNVIQGFRPGDTIELPGVKLTAPVYDYGTVDGQPGTLNLQTSGSAGAGAINLYLDGDYRLDTFQITSDGSGIVVLAPSGGATTDTVPAAGGVSRSLAFGNATVAAIAGPLLAGISTSHTLFLDAAGTAAMASGQSAVVDDASGASAVIGNSVADETVTAGAGNFTFSSGTGSGTVLAGGGADLAYLGGGGNWFAGLGDGTDTVNAPVGNDTIGTGTGHNLIFLGAGASSVGSAGTDTILGGAGSETVAADGANDDLVFSIHGPLQFIGGTGASTIVAGVSGGTFFGGDAGGSLMFTQGPTRYWGSVAADTVVGLTGSLTVIGGSGKGEYFGGTAGDNLITAGSGETTAFGGGSGDVLVATGASADLFAGATGSETLTGVASSGANTFFAGTGDQELVAGSGATALVAGDGDDLLVGGTALTSFIFSNGRASGADTISGWDAGHDYVDLVGYSSPVSSILQTAVTLSNGSTQLTLPDGSSITFAGISQVYAGNFL